MSSLVRTGNLSDGPTYRWPPAPANRYTFAITEKAKADHARFFWEQKIKDKETEATERWPTSQFRYPIVAAQTAIATSRDNCIQTAVNSCINEQQVVQADNSIKDNPFLQYSRKPVQAFLNSQRNHTTSNNHQPTSHSIIYSTENPFRSGNNHFQAFLDKRRSNMTSNNPVWDSESQPSTPTPRNDISKPLTTPNPTPPKAVKEYVKTARTGSSASFNPVANPFPGPSSGVTAKTEPLPLNPFAVSIDNTTGSMFAQSSFGANFPAGSSFGGKYSANNPFLISSSNTTQANTPRLNPPGGTSTLVLQPTAPLNSSIEFDSNMKFSNNLKSNPPAPSALFAFPNCGAPPSSSKKRLNLGEMQTVHFDSFTVMKMKQERSWESAPALTPRITKRVRDPTKSTINYDPWVHTSRLRPMSTEPFLNIPAVPTIRSAYAFPKLSKKLTITEDVPALVMHAMKELRYKRGIPQSSGLEQKTTCTQRNMKRQ